MRISVGDGDLHRILARFKSVPGTRVEIVMSPEGLDVIGNAEGYRTLAKWCLIMAHPEMEQAHPRWLFALRHLDRARLGNGELAIAWRGRDGERSLSLRDIHFFRTPMDNTVDEASEGRPRG
jgi:hypothetical protein